MTTDISVTGLGIGLLLLLVPLYFLHKYKTGLVHATLNGIVRMIVQLYLVGFYLQYLFEYNLWYVNFAWGLVMVLVATGTAVQRIRLRPHVLAVPLGVAFLVTSLVVALYFIGLVLGFTAAPAGAPDAAEEGFAGARTLFTARYFIPIFGLLLGNMLSVNVVALNTYCDGLKRERQLFYYLLGNGATLREATTPLVRAAIVKAFNPCIANMAVMGLVAMPGTMIGQILGGSNPDIAIKYQMMIVVITFVASMLSLMLTLKVSGRQTFDRYGRIKDVFR